MSSSTLRLSEVARQLVKPADIDTTGWPAVEDRLCDMGILFDPWQQGLAQLALGKRAGGFYAATVGGVVMSIPRQVGKTFSVGALLLALCIEFPGLKVLWTAHRLSTSTSAFRSMKSMARRKRVLPHIMPGRNKGTAIRDANGEQEIPFRNGSIIMFGAREQGFGRGFENIDMIVFDEAQILTEKALEDMVATTNQSKHPHGALLFYMGTPPRPVDPGEAFTFKRNKALSGQSRDMVYLEFAADKDAKLDDRKQWAKANPSFPSRTPLESMLRLRENLPSDDAWRREALGIWDDDATTGVFGPGKWESCASAEFTGKFECLVVATAVDQSGTCIAGVGMDGDRYAGKPLEYGPGQSWAVGSLRALYELNQVPVVLDGRGPAAALVPHLRAAGVAVEVLDTAQVLDAHANLFQLVQDGLFRHAKYPELEAAVAGATTRPVGDRWAWARRKSAADISPLEAVTLGVGFLYRPDRSEPVFAFS